MIPDWDTDHLYLSGELPNRHPSFYAELCGTLEVLNIPHTLLSHTADIWARDYMPVQVSQSKLVSFLYQPDYLQLEDSTHLQTNPDPVLKELGIPYQKSGIKIDGGNLVYCSNKVIMTEKVFLENSSFGKGLLISKLEALFGTDQLFFIPKQPYDYLGHADGMLRFIDDETLLINDYRLESKSFQKRFMKAIDATGLAYELFPYNVSANSDKDSGVGTYINFLRMKQGIIIPIFGLPEDEMAIERTKQLFPNTSIQTLNASELAIEGGVLNCISWSYATA